MILLIVQELALSKVDSELLDSERRDKCLGF